MTRNPSKLYAKPSKRPVRRSPCALGWYGIPAGGAPCLKCGAHKGETCKAKYVNRDG